MQKPGKPKKPVKSPILCRLKCNFQQFDKEVYKKRNAVERFFTLDRRPYKHVGCGNQKSMILE